MLATLRRNGGLWFQRRFVIAAIPCAAATVIMFDRSGPTDAVPDGLLSLLIVNMVILVILALMIVTRYRAIRKNRMGAGGGRLTRRFMLLFGIVAMIPAIIVSLFL